MAKIRSAGNVAGLEQQCGTRFDACCPARPSLPVVLYYADADPCPTSIDLSLRIPATSPVSAGAVVVTTGD